ncbi:Ca2+-binding EF-hand superfamily protein [Nocardia mexicana]|uniref:Ca2+-binding EF-hand superfamily protein n=1 Tax=Nocardia mexicana TaxID=279262 RepID=A0A370H839_9NOCA|nr:Ca2+-binding EF-hand superfamily protein [Nocardia mexicana]
MTSVVDCSDSDTGTLINVEPLPRPLWPEGTERGYRIEYVAPNFSGGKRAVSGSVFVPAPTTGTAPVLTWAHCTVGLNEHDAPSKVGLIPEERRHLAYWLAAGFVVAATDYEGLGTDEPHPYLDGEAIADDVIDIVRAVHGMDLNVDERTVIAGFSQGGHGSLFAAALCTAYAPDLNLLGTVSLAPPIRFLDFVREFTSAGDGSVHTLIPMIMAGLRIRRPEFKPEERLTPAGCELVDAATRTSMKDLDALCSATTNDAAGITGISTWKPFVEALESTSPPESRYDRPIFLCSGGADPVFTPKQGRGFSDAVSKSGTSVTFLDLESLDHVALLEPAAHRATRWAADLIAADANGDAGEDVPRASGQLDGRDPRFRVLDATGDGRIGLDDFRAHALRLVSSFGRPLGDPVAARVRAGYEQLARQLIEHYDRDGDGDIDLEEFVAGRTGQVPAQIADSAQTLVRAVVQLIDDDGDRRVSRAEFRSVTRGLGIPADESDTIFDRTDADGSGYLGDDELAAGVVEFLTGTDDRSPGYWLFGRSA